MDEIRTDGHDAAALTGQPAIELKTPPPKGVLRKGLQTWIYLGVAVAFVIATFISSETQHKARSAKATNVPAPAVLPVDETKVNEFGQELEKRQASPAEVPANAYPVQPEVGQPGVPTYGAPGQAPYPGPPPYPGQPAAPSADAVAQRDPVADQERELAFKSRFASNLAYSQSRGILDPTRESNLSLVPAPPQSSASALPSLYASAQGLPGIVLPPLGALPPTTAPQTQAPAPASEPGPKKPAEVNADSASGPPYVIFEGTIVETALMNRIDGDAVGPVKVLVTNPVYSHDRQHVLIPAGTQILGESKKIGASGFGQQRRIAIVFHRMLMPDGFSVDLDQFHGLDQIGQEGAKDKVNNHYMEIFGASIALGLIAGAAEASNGNVGLNANGVDAYKSGVASSMSQSSSEVLDRFINIPPTITIREGQRIKVYISQDMLLPALENHTMPPNL